MSDAKTLGTIGQMYENRKSGKSGKLVSNERDCMNFVDANGLEFQVSFGSFKSNWRKVQTSEESVAEETTAEEKTETADAVKKVVEKAKKKAEKKPREKKGSMFEREDCIKVFNEHTMVVKDLVPDDFGVRLKVSTREGFGIIIKDGRLNAFEVWDKPSLDCFYVCMNQEMYESIDWAANDCMSPVDIKDAYKLKYVMRFDYESKFEKVVELLLRAEVELINKRTAERAENTEHLETESEEN